MTAKNKLVYLSVIILLIIPFSYAQGESCGITNLASCIPEKLYQYTLDIINAPLQPFLTLTKNLLSEPVNVEGLISLWAIIIYIISIFYGLFIILAGFNFIISGYSAERREKAKIWLRDIILMIFFVQASYYLYSILIELSSAMTASVINLIEDEFFLLTADNLINLGLQLVFAATYMLVLLLTIILLALRYLLVAVGVVFFPIGLFFNFITPLKSFGKLILNILLIIIFLPFFQCLILLAASMLIEIPIFENFKILVMTASFLMINLSMILLTLFAVIKAALAVIKSDLGKAVTTVITKMG